MNRIGKLSICVGLFLAGMILGWWLGNPSEVDAKAVGASGCSVKSLKGDYLYALDGYNITGPTADDRLPFAQVGREHYDGDGHMSGVYSASLNGQIVRGTYSGTYTMESACRGTVTFTDNLGATFHYDIFIGEDSDEFVYLQTDPNVVTAGYERRKL